MKVDREKIKGLNVVEYAEHIFEQPTKIYSDILKLAILREKEKRHALTRWNFHTFYISDTYKSDGFIKHYKAYVELFESWHTQFKAKIKPLEEQSTEAFTALAIAGVYPLKEGKILSEWEMMDLLDSCGIDKWTKFAELFYNGALSVFRETLDRKKRFDNEAEAREIDRLENKDFDFANCIIDGLSCIGILNKGADVAMKLADELAELTYYKSLVNDNEYTEKQENNDRKTISQRLDLLESLGVFTLPAFQIDNYKTDNSIRNVSRLLSDILGERDETIRTTIKRKGMSFNKGA